MASTHKTKTWFEKFEKYLPYSHCSHTTEEPPKNLIFRSPTWNFIVMISSTLSAENLFLASVFVAKLKAARLGRFVYSCLLCPQHYIWSLEWSSCKTRSLTVAHSSGFICIIQRLASNLTGKCKHLFLSILLYQNCQLIIAHRIQFNSLEEITVVLWPVWIMHIWHYCHHQDIFHPVFNIASMNFTLISFFLEQYGSSCTQLSHLQWWNVCSK